MKVVSHSRLVGRAGFEPATFCTSKKLLRKKFHQEIDRRDFRDWAFRKYRESYAPTVLCYARKYQHLMAGNLAEVEAFSDSKRNSVLKALISLSKYVGTYREFKAKMKAYGIGWSRTSSVDAFLRIMSNRNSDVLKWLREVCDSKPITYDMVQKRLYRRSLPTRIQDLRDYWGTFMLRHGLIKEEVDLLQGRISKSIFVRHYWSPAIRDLRDRVFTALDDLRPLLP